MTVCGGVPPRIRCRTPLRRRSCTMRPVRPSSTQAFAQSFRKSPMRRPFRWKMYGQVHVAEWLDRYDTERPHSALGYQTPKEYRERLAA